MDHQLKREKNRLEAMMEHLYPKTVKISTSETNNNNDKTNVTSTKIAVNEREKEYKTYEHTNYSDKKENDLSEEDTNHMMKPIELKALSSNDEISSALISPQERKISRKECTNSLKPLIVDEHNVIQPKMLKRETPVSKENFSESNNKNHILDLEEKMQRERARILGGYSNTLGNAQRVREDQVLSQSYTYMEYQPCLKIYKYVEFN